MKKCPHLFKSEINYQTLGLQHSSTQTPLKARQKAN